jgi:hypothetical protein
MHGVRLKPTIDFEVFANVDMRVAQVVDAPMASGTKSRAGCSSWNSAISGAFARSDSFALVRLGDGMF